MFSVGKLTNQIEVNLSILKAQREIIITDAVNQAV